MKTIAGLFDTSEGAEQAVEALRRSGFDEGHISVVTQDTALQDRLGGGPPIGTGSSDQASETPAGTTPVFAAGSAGTVLGPSAVGRGIDADANDPDEALMELGIGRDEAHYYVEAVQHGGILVAVKADEDRAARVEEIFRQASAVNYSRES